MTEERKAELERRFLDEVKDLGGDIQLPLFLDLQSAVCLLSQLQLALRHPGNKGVGRTVARRAIDGIMARLRECGYEATAELCALGDSPEYDVAAPAAPPAP